MNTKRARVLELEKNYYGVDVEDGSLETRSGLQVAASPAPDEAREILQSGNLYMNGYEVSNGLEDLANLDIGLSIELGKLRMSASDLLDLEIGSVLEVSYDRQEPVELKVGEESVGRGKLVFEGDELFLEITSLCFDNQDI